MRAAVIRCILATVSVVACAYPLLASAADQSPPAGANSTAPAADGQLEEITVTARKTTENLQSVPASISVVTAKDLASRGTDSFADVIAAVPNVSMSGGIAGVLQGELGIRGVSTLVRNIGVESGVGIYVDGVYIGRSDNYNQELIDTSQIEVLRGPQGTLFGKNTIAGVFNITTVEPDGAAAGTLKLEAGNYDLFRAQGYVDGPLIDGTLDGKLSAGYVYRDGVYRNLAGGPNGDRLDMDSVRGALYFTPTQSTKFVLAVDGLRDRGNPAFFQATDLLGAITPMATTPHVIDPDHPDYLHRNNYGVSLTGTIHLTADQTLTSISAFRHASYEASLDDDQSQLNYVGADRWGDDTRFFSQELRLNGHLSDSFTYVAGLYYFDQRITTDRLLALGSGLLALSGLSLPFEPALTTVGAVSTRDYAAFGNVTYNLNRATALTLGLRYSNEQKHANFTQSDPTGIFTALGIPNLSFQGSANNGDLSPTLSLSEQLTPDVLGYVRYARGFKSAAFNVDIVSSTSGLQAGPEHADTYEVGLKSDLLDRRLRANVAVFDTVYSQMQVSQLLGSGITLNNAGKSTIKGYEVELNAFPVSHLRLDASIGYLDPIYDHYQDCGIPASLGGGVTDCSGKQIIGAAKYTLQGAGQWEQPLPTGKLVLHVDYNVQSPVFFEATNSQRFASDWRHILDARIGYSGQWDVFLWARNLLNATYITYRDDRSAIGVLQTTAYGDPRTYGVSVATHF